MARKLKQRELKEIKSELIKKQQGRCPLCDTDLTRIKPVNVVVDHDHDTGIIRAALCRGCNGMEGKVKRLLQTWGKSSDLIKSLHRLVNYWALHRKPQTGWIYPTHKTAEEKLAMRNAKARARYHAKKLESKP